MKTLNDILILFVTVVLISSCKKEEALSSNMKEQFYIENGNANLPVWIDGNRTSKTFIITVHGGPILGSGYDFYNATFAEKMEENYVMVYWDQRNSSNSHGHLEKESLTIDAFIDDIHLLVQVLKKKYGDDISLFLMGHSWGGMLATSYLLKEGYQDGLKGWINISGTPDAPQELIETPKLILTVAEEEITKGNKVKQWQDIINTISPIDTNNLSDDVVKKIDAQERIMFELLGDQVYPEQHRYKGISKLFSPADNLLLISNLTHPAVMPFLEDVNKMDVVDDLYKITIPTLVQFGKYDVGTSPAVGQLLYSNISSSEKFFDIYEHSEHFCFTQEPELFLENVMKFIEAYK